MASSSNTSLRATDELMWDIADAQRANSFDDCKHEHTEIRGKLASNRMEMVAAQCLRCGDMCGQYIKKVNWPEHRPPWDNNLAHSLDEPRRLAEIAVHQKHLAIQCEEDRRYELYLQSPEWRRRRQRVLERDNYRCQGCGEQRATQVHHRTYQHIYREFLFELISLCDDCHGRLHDNEVAA
jgi:5-methylcytosine-specific restriction endonuclease McrA